MPSKYKDYRGRIAWYDRMQIGLAPEGKVAVWLQGVDLNLITASLRQS